MRSRLTRVKRFTGVVVAALLVAVALAGCGGTKKPADPGRDVLGGFLESVAERDTAEMRRFLSPQSTKRFTDAQLAALSTRLQGLTVDYRVVVSERITDTFGLATVAAGPRVYGAALRKTGDDWGLELNGPVQITPLGPKPGAREEGVAQVAAALDHAAENGVVLLYLDGQSLPDPRVYRSGGEATIFANLDVMAAAGRHTVTAFASAGANASALAWTFVVPR